MLDDVLGGCLFLEWGVVVCWDMAFGLLGLSGAWGVVWWCIYWGVLGRWCFLRVSRTVPRPLPAQAEEAATSALGASKFEAEVNAGKRLNRDDAIRLALGEPAQVANGRVRNDEVGLLGRREAEVARLVAEGMSNRQIGAKLFISERTVDSHVRSVLNKLGFNSRAQIAGWIASSSRAS